MRVLVIAIMIMLVATPAAAQFRSPAPYTISRINGEVEIGWYATSKVYRYIIDLNLAFNFGLWNDIRFAFGGGILTLVKSGNGSSFQPDRYRGTIETAAYVPDGSNVYFFSIRHQSFHTIDREPLLKESCELYNIGYQHWGKPNVVVAVGKYLNKEDIDYEWDFLLDIDTACVGSCRYGPIYVSGTAEYVTASGLLSGRDSFFDYALEAGVQTPSGARYFASYRQVHDIENFNGTTDHQVIIGMRYLW